MADDRPAALVVTTTGLDAAARDCVRKAAEQAGGRYSPNLSRRCSHLVVGNDRSRDASTKDGPSAKLRTARALQSRWRVAIVSPEKFLASARRPPAARAWQPPWTVHFSQIPHEGVYQLRQDACGDDDQRAADADGDDCPPADALLAAPESGDQDSGSCGDGGGDGSSGSDLGGGDGGGGGGAPTVLGHQELVAGLAALRASAALEPAAGAAAAGAALPLPPPPAAAAAAAAAAASGFGEGNLATPAAPSGRSVESLIAALRDVAGRSRLGSAAAVDQREQRPPAPSPTPPPQRQRQQQQQQQQSFDGTDSRAASVAELTFALTGGTQGSATASSAQAGPSGCHSRSISGGGGGGAHAPSGEGVVPPSSVSPHCGSGQPRPRLPLAGAVALVDPHQPAGQRDELAAAIVGAGGRVSASGAGHLGAGLTLVVCEPHRAARFLHLLVDVWSPAALLAAVGRAAASTSQDEGGSSSGGSCSIGGSGSRRGHTVELSADCARALLRALGKPASDGAAAAYADATGGGDDREGGEGRREDDDDAIEAAALLPPAQPWRGMALAAAATECASCSACLPTSAAAPGALPALLSAAAAPLLPPELVGAGALTWSVTTDPLAIGRGGGDGGTSGGGDGDDDELLEAVVLPPGAPPVVTLLLPKDQSLALGHTAEVVAVPAGGLTVGALLAAIHGHYARLVRLDDAAFELLRRIGAPLPLPSRGGRVPRSSLLGSWLSFEGCVRLSRDPGSAVYEVRLGM